jgi:Tfp pilus assembly protein PilV
MVIQKRFLKVRTADKEAGIGLVEAIIAAAIIVIAAVGIFKVLDYAARQNTSAAQSWAQVESAMTDWSQSTVPVSIAQTVSVTVSGATTGQQTESVSVAETASGSTPYGWWRSEP